MTCFVTYLASIGGSRHLYYLTAEQALKAVKWSWISQPWGIFLFATGNASVAILLLRIMGRTSFWRRLTMYGVIISVFITNSLGCIFTFVQCNPPRALWTSGLPAHCWNPHVQEHFNYFMAGTDYTPYSSLYLLTSGSMEYTPGCLLSTIPNHDHVESENGSCEKNCFVLSSRSWSRVSNPAPLVTAR